MESFFCRCLFRRFFPLSVFFFFFFNKAEVAYVFADFKCTSWQPHEKLGHTRNVSFQHPIKIYFGNNFLSLRYIQLNFISNIGMHDCWIPFKGAKFGGCQESQKFRMYRDRYAALL